MGFAVLNPSYDCVRARPNVYCAASASASGYGSSTISPLSSWYMPRRLIPSNAATL